jgi:hypothetical protein
MKCPSTFTAMKGDVEARRDDLVEDVATTGWLESLNARERDFDRE